VSESALVVDGVAKRYRIYHERNQSLKAALMRGKRASYEDFWALDDVSFEVPQGSTFGLMGNNGSGKSTLLKCMARILVPNRGAIDARGSLAALLELGSGFHPELSGRENVFLNGSILGLTKKQVSQRFDEIVDFSGVEQFIDQPVKNYSSGMYVRLAFSVAINVTPDILLVDEVLAVGDAGFQEKCMAKFAEYRAEGRTVVLVTHSMDTVRSLCDQVAWLDRGRLKAVGSPAAIVDAYLDAGHAATVHKESGGSRFGSGEARLNAVRFVDAEGVAAQTIRTGDWFTLIVDFEVVKPLRQSVVGIAVHTSDGQLAFGTNSRDSGQAADLTPGHYTAEFTVPHLPLRAGRYEVAAAVADFSGAETYDHVRGLAYLNVLHGPDTTSSGLVAAGGTWSELIRLRGEA
jgi:ABC-2 type transport system ATP-binding protein